MVSIETYLDGGSKQCGGSRDGECGMILSTYADSEPDRSYRQEFVDGSFFYSPFGDRSCLVFSREWRSSK